MSRAGLHRQKKPSTQQPNEGQQYGSYRIVPPRQQAQKCSGKTDLCREVINTTLRSFPSYTSETEIKSLYQKNAGEEALSRCEDEMYEMDILLETVRRFIAILDEFYENNSEDDSVDFSKHGINECIYRELLCKIYGERGAEMFDVLKKTPQKCLLIIKQRLEQKQMEWREIQGEWCQIWKKVQEKNYHRSLESRVQSARTACCKEQCPPCVTDMKTLLEKGDSERTFSFQTEDIMQDMHAVIVRTVKRKSFYDQGRAECRGGIC